MSEPENINVRDFGVEDLHFVQGRPEQFNNFEQIYELRRLHYSVAMREGAGEISEVDGQPIQRRSYPEILNFVRRLTPANWNDPGLSVRGTVQRRYDPWVVAGFDENERLQVLTHGAYNVSDGRPEPVGAALRFAKKHVLTSSRYAWVSESVTNPDRPDLAMVGRFLWFQNFDLNGPGSQWPYKEEVSLRRDLREIGHKETGEKPVEGTDGFGVGFPGTTESFFVVPRLDMAIGKIASMPGIAPALEHARNNLRTAA